MKRFASTAIAGAILVVAGCSSNPQKGRPADAGGTGGSGSVCANDAAGGDATLASIVPIVVRTCARAGCHDPIRHEHGMDLSTAELIYTNWVGTKGLDHCSNKPAMRVVPGDPDNSFVMTKIRAPDVICSLETRMPPPPAEMLPACEIEAIRRWIVAGAPGPIGVTDGGADVAGDASDPDVADAGGDDGDSDAPEPGTCTTATPCDPASEVCVESLPGGSSDNCYTRWECYAHAPDDDTRAHMCPAETAFFCGCDGTTFEASWACPYRPFDHVGACGDGYSCNVDRVRCNAAEPSCPAGQVPSVVAGCWGSCVPIAMCRCDVNWRCPRTDIYRCSYYPEFRCGPIPPPQDGGADAIN
jgi:hypothetical protein